MSRVVADLERFGPGPKQTVLSPADAERYCADLARSQYENFPVAGGLIPRHLRPHFRNVYAFCRWADDLGDEIGDPDRSLELLAWWRSELDRCFAGVADHPVYIALRTTIERFRIPREPFADLISAFVQDQSKVRYETFSELLDYCRRSADPVGRLVLHLCQRHTPDTVPLADSVCTGLQLANFWQDVARDFRIGRIYVPQEDRERFAVGESEFAQPEASERFKELIRFEVDRARTYLMKGAPLGRMLPGRIGWEIDVIRAGGLLILDGIERIDFDVLRRRPVVSKRRLATAACATVVRRLVSW